MNWSTIDELTAYYNYGEEDFVLKVLIKRVEMFRAIAEGNVLKNELERCRKDAHKRIKEIAQETRQNLAILGEGVDQTIKGKLSQAVEDALAQNIGKYDKIRVRR